MNLIKGFLILVTLFLLPSCKCNNRKNVSLPDAEINLPVKRLDLVLFQLGTDSLGAKFRVMNEKYDDFLSFYVTNILSLGDYKKQPEQTIENLAKYLNDPYVQEVRDSCEKVFSDFSPYKKKLEQALRYFKYYFPEKPLPQVVTFLSNFSYSAITFDTLYLGIGLDMHLGENFKYYTDLYPRYMYEKFSSEYLVANSVKALATQHFQIEPKDNTVLSQMIAKGIALHFTDLLMPDAEDYKKIGYNPEDIQWCMMSEPEIWKFFVDKQLLYSTDMLQNRQYISPGPSASGMPREAPGNIGSWLGWRIVRAYVKKYPDTKFEELLKIEPQEMLVKSGYKPARNLF
ncbi:MAG: hypothetical protein SH857_15010 [Chitinophagales bacterium]|nr:hypothetical protein [Chitinophagales bacterium]